jgi:hypothetical protein
MCIFSPFIEVFNPATKTWRSVNTHGAESEQPRPRAGHCAVRYRVILILMRAGNTEQGKCRLMNEYPFFLFKIGHWYYEKKLYL